MYNSNMTANESVFLRSIRDVVGEVLRDLRASVAERAFYRLHWLLDIVNRYADSLTTTVDLDEVHFLLASEKLASVCVPIAGLLRRKSPSQSLVVIVADLATGAQWNSFSF